jgi:pimeloyl-ACP methyl ester carboxylesterase
VRPPVAGVEHRFVEANGLRFHVAECGAGDRLALLLHGFPEFWFSWRHQMPLLARLGYRVWAPDLRGYGESERPPRTADYDVELLLADVAGIIDAAAPRETLLVGHDWGGILAWFFALRRLRPLDRLVVVNCPHPGAARPAFRRLRQLRRSWYALFFQLPWLPERLLSAGGGRAVAQMLRRTSSHPERFPGDVLAAYAAQAAEPGAAKAMIDYYRMFLRGPGARRLRAFGTPVIETPTLLLWGEEDVALTVETTFGTERFVPNLTLRYLPGVSHWAQQDDPDTVNAMLEAWLAGRPVPEARDLVGSRG